MRELSRSGSKRKCRGRSLEIVAGTIVLKFTSGWRVRQHAPRPAEPRVARGHLRVLSQILSAPDPGFCSTSDCVLFIGRRAQQSCGFLEFLVGLS